VKTRYEMVIDLGEHESAEEARETAGRLRRAMSVRPTLAPYSVRPSLPVLPTCGDCHHHGAALGKWWCFHEGRVDPVTVDLDAAPPMDCPMRKGAP
jgi:hypothetical protein